MKKFTAQGVVWERLLATVQDRGDGEVLLPLLALSRCSSGTPVQTFVCSAGKEGGEEKSSPVSQR